MYDIVRPSYTIARPASPKQRVFVEKLLAEKDTTGTAYEGWTPDWDKASGKDASGVIDYLLTLPRKKETVITEEPKAGIYNLDDMTLIRVYHGQQSGHMLVKIVNIADIGEVTYEYWGAASKIFREHRTVRLSLAEVGKLGIESGTCIVCGRRLDDPESVDAGIGPVCAEKY